MRSGLAGAAVAAGVMLCGWMGAQKAEAAPIYNAVFSIGRGSEVDVFGINGPSSTACYLGSCVSAVTSLSITPEDSLFHYVLNLVAFGFGPPPPQNPGDGYLIDFEFDITLDVLTPLGLSPYPSRSVNITSIVNDSSFARSFTVDFTGYTDPFIMNQPVSVLELRISEVPLPSSLALGGLALTALGSIGVVRRRARASVHRADAV